MFTIASLIRINQENDLTIEALKAYSLTNFYER